MRSFALVTARRPETLGRSVHYAIAAGLVVLAIALRVVIAPVNAGFPFITFFPATALAALIGGLGPGIMVALCGGFLASAFFFPYPISDFTGEDWGPVVFYVLTEVIICMVIDAMHAANGRYLTLAEEVQSLRSAAPAQTAPAEAQLIRLRPEATAGT